MQTLAVTTEQLTGSFLWGHNITSIDAQLSSNLLTDIHLFINISVHDQKHLPSQNTEHKKLWEAFLLFLTVLYFDDMSNTQPEQIHTWISPILFAFM